MTRRLVSVLALMAALASPARAHLLKVFATVEDGAVGGYGFFIGGGRPAGATVIMRDAQGRDLWRGEADATGRFFWRPEKPTALTVIVNARDGHVAEAKIALERFFGAATGPSGPQADDRIATNTAKDSGAPSAAPNPSSGGCAAATDAEGLAPLIDRAVDAAVARQIRPLLEAYEVASKGARMSDLIGGIGMIAGLAGLGMWAFSRRRHGGRA